MALPVLHRPGESEGLHGVHRARELCGGDDQGERAGLLEGPSGRLPNCSAVPGASRDDDSDVCSSFIMGQVSGSRTPCVFTMKKPQMGCHLHFKGGNTEAQRDEHMAT